jgi:hypothetical protein
LPARFEAVILELMFEIAAGGFPFALDSAFVFETVAGGVERAMLDLQEVVRCALDVLSHLVTVSRAELEGSEDQHVEPALQELDAAGKSIGHSLSRHSTQSHSRGRIWTISSDTAKDGDVPSASIASSREPPPCSVRFRRVHRLHLMPSAYGITVGGAFILCQVV